MIDKIKYFFFKLRKFREDLKLGDTNFKKPKRKVYFGKRIIGAPYFYPNYYEAFLISIRRTPRKYRLAAFSLFGFYFYLGFPIYLSITPLGWKDKFNSPRHEFDPMINLYLFNYQLVIKYGYYDEHGYSDLYWEQILWYSKYKKSNLIKAKKSWPWINTETRTSTWKDVYLSEKGILQLKQNNYDTKSLVQTRLQM